MREGQGWLMMGLGAKPLGGFFCGLPSRPPRLPIGLSLPYCALTCCSPTGGTVPYLHMYLVYVIVVSVKIARAPDIAAGIECQR